MPPSTAEITNLTASFSTGASDYERHTGGATRAVATHLPSLLPPLPPAAVIHDNACGVGSVTTEFLKVQPDLHVHATDLSQNMIDSLAAQIPQLVAGTGATVSAAAMDGQDLKFPDATFDVSVTNFGVFFFPDPLRGVREIWRTLKPGGTAVVTAWEVIGFLPMFWEVQRVVGPAKVVGLPTLEKWMRRETLEGVMGEAGFGEVRMERKEVFMGWAAEEEMLDGLTFLFLGPVGEEWSAEEKGRFGAAMERVAREQKGKLLVEDGGRVGVWMKAWIALARK